MTKRLLVSKIAKHFLIKHIFAAVVLRNQSKFFTKFSFNFRAVLRCEDDESTNLHVSCFLVGCEKLVDKDIVSRSDPMCVLFMKAQNSWLEVGRTEEIKGEGMKSQIHHAISADFRENCHLCEN